MCKTSLPGTQGPPYSAALEELLGRGGPEPRAREDVSSDPDVEQLLQVASINLSVAAAPELTYRADALGAGAFVGALLNLETLRTILSAVQVLQRSAPAGSDLSRQIRALEVNTRFVRTGLAVWIRWALAEQPELERFVR